MKRHALKISSYREIELEGLVILMVNWKLCSWIVTAINTFYPLYYQLRSLVVAVVTIIWRGHIQTVP